MWYMSEVVQSILDMIRRLPPDERVQLADEVDRLTWRDRMQVVLDSIAEKCRREGPPPTDEEIDAIVDQVRSEKSLNERYWTRRQQSAR
jgi:hypothetical protein